MTVDDDNSIYVGGIPYDCTEATLRKAFDSYGQIVAVKIVNERGFGGKCYGFVTFRTPRAAIDAINGMNGRKIDGRVVRVNEVKTRGGRTSFNRDSDRRSTDRGPVWDRSTNRERTSDNENERYQDRDNNQSRERERSHDRDQGRERGREHMHDRNQGRERGHELMRDRDHGRERGHEHIHDRDQGRERGHEHMRDRDHGRERRFEHMHDRDRTRDPFLDRDQERNREGIDKEQNTDHDQNSERVQDVEWNRDVVTKRNDDRGNISEEHKDQQSNKRSGSSFSGPDSKGCSSPSSGGHPDQVKRQLASTVHRRGELQSEISHLEEKVEDQQQRVFDLQKQSQKLEDTLILVRKLHQQRQMQLMKLHKCFMQVKDFTGRLKSSEQELQELVDSAMMEIDFNSDGVVRDRVVANGST